ncbi:MAG: molybdenum cofactor biosynthesis protein MoaE [gamma proteobacterium symbiont of Bathyaustriella thionipta]|nr:molybdenum cofactor biosynthesis protein MoaE [gamma proteobacterium symbiont of Bathyaustriella thionipta]MCU7949172.1 molybdenum cofactor biosynthesis protein MoaE [gamma proteobacterium symbiont of Bathyaustriella thionipta]MCU7954794.1 molybdenum cofactor biosynthesis protein MoaE [gamma proteobacterium symbiont of Bathyaustriella thionipta]MCU7956705.1 molybdenum cofactor biosynthesis protein MoaE [gamma proteobacterium symbiont of Bathyaustriella thionipta]MCU7966137.1 molybdenum cofac
MKIMIDSDPFDPWQVLSDYQKENTNLEGQYGATAVFVGTMRDFNEGDNVAEMFLEHYPGMTDRHLENICLQATGEHQLLESLVVHRVGTIRPNDPIVLVAVWTAHRKQAFEACREIMEDLKSKAPFWKKEQLNDGQDRWVEKNTRGY